MKQVFQYFNLSLREQRGFILLSIITLFSVTVPYIYDAVRREENLEYDLVSLEERGTEEIDYNDHSSSLLLKSSKKGFKITPFNPNGLSIDEWQKMGLSAEQAKVIKNYEAKGGRFKKKEDLSRIYSLSPTDYKRLEPYIVIDKKNSDQFREGRIWSKVDNDAGKNNDVDRLLDIGNADSADWVALKGIGPILAKRIIKFKDALGGFVDIAQIGEVYGLPEETYKNIQSKLTVGNSILRKLNINSATIEELNRHPYITKKQAQWIISYRDQHGAYKSLQDLIKVEMLNSEFLRKIEPYLEL